MPLATEVFPKCLGCGRSNLTWWACKSCPYVGCDICWRSKHCPACDGIDKEVRKQRLDIGESWLRTRLTFNKRGEYVPYEILGRLVRLMQAVDKPELKASAALLVGTMSFFALLFHIDNLKLAAAVVGMTLPATWLACRILKGPTARWQSRVMDYRGAMLSKLHNHGHFSVSQEDSERWAQNHKD